MNNTKSVKIIIFASLIAGVLIGGFLVLRSSSSTASNNKVEAQPTSLNLVGNINSTVNSNADANSVADMDNAVTESNNFNSKNLGYSLSVPENWYSSSLSNIYEENNNTSDQDYFSNEDIGTPLEMSENGTWITVSRTLKNNLTLQNFIASETENWIVKQPENLIINGYSAIRQLEEPKPEYESEAGYDVFVYIDSGDYFFKFSILSVMEEGFKANETAINSIVGSFKII